MSQNELTTLFMVQNVWHSNGPPSYVTIPFDDQTPILSGIQMVTVFSQPFGALLFETLLPLKKFVRIVHKGVVHRVSSEIWHNI